MVELEHVEQSEKDILINMASLFLHDLSEFSEYECFNPSSGMFEFDGIDEFWEKERLKPFFITSDQRIVGFILFHYDPSRKDHECYINSFFILRKYRNQGIGAKAAAELFKRYPGKYLVTQVIRNTMARSFWHGVYQKNNIQFTEQKKEWDGQLLYFQTFTYI